MRLRRCSTPAARNRQLGILHHTSGVRRQVHAVRSRAGLSRRAGRWLAKLPYQQPPRPKGFLARDDLFDAGRSQRLENRLRAADTEMAVPLTCLDQWAMFEPWPETPGIIGRPEQARQLIKAPLGALTPRSSGHLSGHSQ